MSQKPHWLVDHGKPWTTSAPGQVIYDNPWICLTEHQAIAPTGHAARYGVVGFKNYAIAVLPIHADGQVTLVGQNRFPLGGYSWEIPEGGGAREDAPLDSAKRELREETGMVAGQWQQVLTLQLSNSVTNEEAFGFLATDLSQIDAVPQGDETEDIARVTVPFHEALAAAMAGHMPDALTVVMLLKAYHMAKEGSLPAPLARAMLGEPAT